MVFDIFDHVLIFVSVCPSLFYLSSCVERAGIQYLLFYYKVLMYIINNENGLDKKIYRISRQFPVATKVDPFTRSLQFARVKNRLDTLSELLYASS